MLPAAIRHRRGQLTGEQVLLVADPAHGVLVVQPLAVLDDTVTGYYRSLLRRSQP